MVLTETYCSDLAFYRRFRGTRFWRGSARFVAGVYRSVGRVARWQVHRTVWKTAALIFSKIMIDPRPVLIRGALLRTIKWKWFGWDQCFFFFFFFFFTWKFTRDFTWKYEIVLSARDTDELEANSESTGWITSYEFMIPMIEFASLIHRYISIYFEYLADYYHTGY